MEHMNPSLLQSVTRPHRMWRRLGAGSKLAMYTRLSMQIAILGLGVAAIILTITGPRRNDVTPADWQTALVVLATILMTGLVVAVTETRPEFTTVPRNPRPRLLLATAVFSAALLASGLLMFVWGDPGTALNGLFLIMVAYVMAPLGVLPWVPFRWPVTIAITALTMIVVWPELGWAPVLFAVFLLATTTISAWTVDLAKQLDRARVAESALQVSEERLRFSQELHDTLGQRLAAMSVKAELARALARRGDDRVDGELAELQELARTSVTEMHEVVEGYRAVNLSTEVEGARQLLDSAGVRLTIDGDPTALSDPLREVAAWLVREGTTNVVRHSAATEVTLSFVGTAPESVRMTNNGVSRGIERLSGLAGIRRRAEPLGAQLVAERDGNLFHVTLTLKEEP